MPVSSSALPTLLPQPIGAHTGEDLVQCSIAPLHVGLVCTLSQRSRSTRRNQDGNAAKGCSIASCGIADHEATLIEPGRTVGHA